MKHALGLALSVGAAALPLSTGCGDDGGGETLPPLFEPKPECEGATITPFAGDHQNVISFLEIGDLDDGFDLDGDGDPDNKLAAVGSLAREAIEDAINQYDILIPFEFFDLPTVGDDECVKFALYLGVFKQDADEDGRDTSVEDGDCDDTRASTRQDMPEIADNLLDDDCDGLTDEIDDATPTANDVDNDGDGVSPADGDCDDTTETGAMSSPNLDEVCGDGLDNDCDGVADRGPADGVACDPYDDDPDELALDPLSFEGGAPVISFTSGEISGGQLVAGPSLFSVSVPVIDGLTLDLRITGATIEADIAMAGDSVQLTNGRLGGVIDAVTADQIRGLEVDEIGLTPENSLLDAVFANILGTLLALPNSKAEGYMTCKTPDIDVDRDGLETFCDSTPADDNKFVDICIDGDGTVVEDTADTQCSEAIDPETGRPRFVDGISVELNFSTVPVILVE